jgi:Ca2+/Na+ antiporter
MKRGRTKSTVVTLALLVYVTIVAIYIAPLNGDVSTTEKVVTVACSYAIVFVLWLVLRKKEDLQQQRFREMEQRKNEEKAKQQ